MKKIGFILVLLLIQLTVNAQAKAEKAVETAVENLRLAMISGERSSLANIVSDKLSYGHSGGKVEDKTAFIESFTSGRSDFVTIELKNQTITVTGKTALVRHQLFAKTNDGGTPAEVHLGVLLVWQKQSGDWKLLGRQAFKLPTN